MLVHTVLVPERLPDMLGLLTVKGFIAAATQCYKFLAARQNLNPKTKSS